MVRFTLAFLASALLSPTPAPATGASLIGTWAFVGTDVNHVIANGFYDRLVREGATAAKAQTVTNVMFNEAKSKNRFWLWEDLVLGASVEHMDETGNTWRGFEYGSNAGVWRVEQGQLFLVSGTESLQPRYTLRRTSLSLRFTRTELISFSGQTQKNGYHAGYDAQG